MSPPSDELQDLLARLISRAHELGTRGIYRGEPECFPQISSGLYRQLHKIDDPRFDIGSAQQRRIQLARQYEPDLNDHDILTRLQHLGGKTNLIDFTRDLNIALFFGSYSSPDEDGRVILMEEPPVLRQDYEVFAPLKLVPRGNPASMTDVQQSVWVEPRNGYIDEGLAGITTIEIPSALKPEVLLHMQVVYGIEASTVYNDLSGLIRDQDQLRDHEAEWYAGIRAYEAGQYESALCFFARYEQLVGPRSDVEYFRGISYWYADRRDEALADMASFRSHSPHDHWAFPEEMEAAYAERQRGNGVDGQRRTDRDAAAPASEVFPGFRIRAVGDVAGWLGTSLKITYEGGHGWGQALRQKDTFVTFRELTPDAGGNWLLSLTRGGYRGVDSRPVRWPVRETLVLKAIDGDSPDIMVEIESLQYTYKPDIATLTVAYPARE